MNWLSAANIGALSGAFSLSLVFIYLAVTEKKDYLKLWAIAFGAAVGHYLMMAAAGNAPAGPLSIGLLQLTALFSGTLVLWGSSLYKNRKMDVTLIVIAGILAVWTGLSIFFQFFFFIAMTPLYLYWGASLAWTAWVLYDSMVTETLLPEKITLERITAQVSFGLLGLGTMLTPFFRLSAITAVWGYLLLTLAEIVLAWAMMAVYLQKFRNELADNSERIPLLLRMVEFSVPESGLAENAERFHLFVEKSRDLVYLFNFQPEFHFTYVNPAYAQASGYSAAEFYDQPALEMAHIHPDDQEIFRQLAENSWPDHSLKIRWLHRDGSTVWTEQWLAPIVDEEGKVLFMMGLGRVVPAPETAQVMEEVQRLAEDQAGENVRIGDEMAAAEEGQVPAGAVATEEGQVPAGAVATEEGQVPAGAVATEEGQVPAETAATEEGQVPAEATVEVLPAMDDSPAETVVIAAALEEGAALAEAGVPAETREAVPAHGRRAFKINKAAKQKIAPAAPHQDHLQEEITAAAALTGADEILAADIVTSVEDIPAAEIVPSAEDIFAAEIIPSAEDIPATEIVPLAEVIPAAEIIPSQEDSPAAEIIPSPEPIPGEDSSQAAAEDQTLLSRADFRDELAAAMKKTGGQGRKLAVLFLNLDSTRQISKLYDHHASVQIIRSCASGIRGLLPQDQLLADAGNNNLLALVPEVDSYLDVERLAEKLLAGIRQSVAAACDYTLLPVIGIAIYPLHGDSPDLLIDNAELAASSGKKSGRQKFIVYDPSLRRGLGDNLRLQEDLRQAMARNEFFLEYQAQFTLAPKQKLAGAEALLRWRHPQKGVLLPEVFQGALEEIGLSSQLGEWVLENACRQFKKWQQCGTASLQIAVNVFSGQFRHRDFAESVQSILQKTELRPEFLVLEISKEIAFENVAQTQETLRKLRRIGVQVTMDNFGGDALTLYQLKDVPVKNIKINRDFLKDYAASSHVADILAIIVNLGSQLGLSTLAEGVEDHRQLDLLTKFGCLQAQGSLLAQPMSGKDFEIRYLICRRPA